MHGPQLRPAPESYRPRNYSALVRDGFVFDRGDGSPQIYYRHDGRRVTILVHGSSRTFRMKTLKSMIDQTQWTEADLKRLKLLP